MWQRSFRVLPSAMRYLLDGTRKGRSARDALGREVRADEDALRELIGRGRNRRDVDGSVIEDLGFRLSVWNGAEEGESDLSVKCGGSASRPTAWIPNSCVLNLPAEGLAFERTHRVPVLLSLVHAIVGAFEPDWAVVTSHAVREKCAKAGQPGDVVVGWLTYLSKRRGELPALPSGVRIAPVGEMGSAMIATECRLSAEDPLHLGLADEIRNRLGRAGLLRRID